MISSPFPQIPASFTLFFVSPYKTWSPHGPLFLSCLFFNISGNSVSSTLEVLSQSGWMSHYLSHYYLSSGNHHPLPRILNGLIFPVPSILILLNSVTNRSIRVTFLKKKSDYVPFWSKSCNVFQNHSNKIFIIKCSVCLPLLYVSHLNFPSHCRKPLYWFCCCP